VVAISARTHIPALFLEVPIVRLSRLTFVVGAAVLSFSLTLFNHGASSQTRTIKIINPYPPGGTADVVARLLGEQIGRTQGVTIIVENRPGAGTVVGTEVAARAASDGNTLLITTPAFVINPHLRKQNYDPLTSFEPICDLTQSSQLIVVNSKSPYQTIGDLISAARAKPGQLTLASAGPASQSQIGFERVKRAANVDMTYVPYPGNAPTINSILGAHVTSAIANYSDVVEHLKSGELRAIAATSSTRIEGLPELPTVAEEGYKEFEYDLWFGLFAPAKTPKEVTSQIAGWYTAAMQVQEVKAKLLVQGLYPVGMCGPAFGALVRRQYDDYGQIIRDANIKAE
jgi:tripartite-type tricarboxylate transporter receptor subunit TctC